MLGRRTLLFLSVIIAVAIHAFFYWLAPRITLGRTFETPIQQKVKEFHFHLREELPPPPPEVETGKGKGKGKGAAATKGLSTRPGSVRDLLKREAETLKPEDAGGGTTEVANLADRAGAEHGAVRPDLAPNPDSLHRADAKIIEIAREDARGGLDIARRVVRPSAERFFPEQEYPALRSTLGDAPEPLVRFEAPGEGLLAKSVAQGVTPEALPGGADTDGGTGALLDAAKEEPETLPLPAEITRAPVEVEKQRAVKETPFQFLDDLVDIQLETYRAPGEDAGYFRVRVKLREGSKPPTAPKDVVFLIDASSSVQQRKLDAAVAGVRDCLNALRSEDRFNIAVFRDTVQAFQSAPVAASADNLESARTFLKKVPSRGETDVYKALSSVIGDATTLGRASQLIVLSDGRPTMGLRDAREIINNVTAANINHHSIYAYAGGNAIDRYLLELLAYRNRGAAAFAEKIEDMKGGLPKFYAAYAGPVLVNVEADYGGLDTKAIFPRDLPDLSAAHPYEVYGRFVPARDKDFVMRLSGRSGSRAKDLVFKLRLDDAAKGAQDIAAGWAFQKSYALIAEIAERGDTPELLSELRALGRKYNIRTVYSE